MGARAAARDGTSAVRSVTLPSGVVSPHLDAEALLAVLDDPVCAAKGAGERPADPDLVLADRRLVVERVERHDALHVRRREIEARRHILDDVVAHETFLLLAEVQKRERRGHLRRITLEDLLELALAFGAQSEGHRGGQSFMGSPARLRGRVE